MIRVQFWVLITIRFVFSSCSVDVGFGLVPILAYFLLSGLVQFLAKPGFQFQFSSFLLGSGSFSSLLIMSMFRMCTSCYHSASFYFFFHFSFASGILCSFEQKSSLGIAVKRVGMLH